MTGWLLVEGQSLIDGHTRFIAASVTLDWYEGMLQLSTDYNYHVATLPLRTLPGCYTVLSRHEDGLEAWAR